MLIWSFIGKQSMASKLLKNKETSGGITGRMPGPGCGEEELMNALKVGEGKLVNWAAW